jgi:GT2 family glycosyltransferase
VALAEANTTAGIVGGRIYFHTDPDRIQYLGGMLVSAIRGPAAVETPERMRRDPVGCGPHWIDLVNSCMSLVRREVFEIAGMYPEFYGRYEYEDYDFAYRARRFGFRSLYCPDAVGYHAVSLSSTANELGPFRARQRARNGVLFMRRWAPRGWWRRYLAYHLAKIPSDALRHGHSAAALLSGYLEGLRLSKRADLGYRRLAPGKRGKRRDVSGLTVVQNG